MLQSLPIPEWKWEHVTRDFVCGLPRTRCGNAAIWVVMDCVTKVTHFLSMKMRDSLEKLNWLYIREIVRLHGVPILFFELES